MALKRGRNLPANLTHDALVRIYDNHLETYSEQLIDEIHHFIKAVESSDQELSGDLNDDTFVSIYEYPLEEESPGISLDGENP